MATSGIQDSVISSKGTGHDMAVEKEDSAVMSSNIGGREVRTTTKDMASGVERGRSWGKVRAEGAKGGAV